MKTMSNSKDEKLRISGFRGDDFWRLKYVPFSACLLFHMQKHARGQYRFKHITVYYACMTNAQLNCHIASEKLKGDSKYFYLHAYVVT